MKRKKILNWFLWFLCFNEIAIYCSCWASDNSESSTHINKFQSALQQQNIVTILGSIEERLRNLDNVYSMQLSQNLETKLDQYNKKLESLDTKIIRLEALMMLNLGKISENISTKNFKDDLTKTDVFRKLDSIYEGINHRLNYIERKIDTSSVKLQETVETTGIRLEKMEREAMKRDSNFENELSITISGIKNLTRNYNNLEKKIANVTEDNMNVCKHTYTLLTKYNIENRKSMNKLHDNIIGNLQYVDNKTSQHVKISEDTNTLLKQIRVDLKEDFNNYANKVADMNYDTEDGIKGITSVANATKIELQNGLRSLMIQVGKITPKSNEFNTGADYQELEKKLSANFEKILTNQDVFLESCHRLQMDESQIESEISVMLNKLIDMLEKKLATETKDIKNFEKNLKNHDSRINRNLLQANENIISLFEKSTANSQMLLKDIRKIGNDLNILSTLVQSTVNDGAATVSATTTKIILDKLIFLEKSTKEIQYSVSNKKAENVSNHQIYKELQKSFKSIITTIQKLENHTIGSCVHKNNLHMFGNNSQKNVEPLNSFVPEHPTDLQNNETVRELIASIFGENPNRTNQKQKKNCNQNIKNLIDIRAHIEDCSENSQDSTKEKKKKYDIDIRGDITDNDKDATTTEEGIISTTEKSITATIEETTQLNNIETTT
ncbi:putative leucine-rich repeat-containing protein DDB_G0290503 [Diorhabda sublineata]|uniref:putative leucine-rich repeat-containing protein DDB_G0290503 n=1 Tax=Diorhabda sublineata TaxID=1163346 RepID=UPI0024E164B4|nr:putative leucine-rich repeat-containing protein DDB_G0290503 [Diorhabda sublineata]